MLERREERLVEGDSVSPRKVPRLGWYDASQQPTIGFLAALTIAAAPLASYWVLSAQLMGGPPVGIITPATQRVVADPAAGKVVATYRIANRGGRNLVIGEVATSCGCSVASIRPRVIKPGTDGIVTVEGDPPAAGERTVRVDVNTNVAAQPKLSFHLTMVAEVTLPYVAHSSGPLRLFALVNSKHLKNHDSIHIETYENIETRPWLAAAQSSLAGVVIKGGLARERELPGAVVHRIYESTAELTEAAKPGDFIGDIIFTCPGTDQAKPYSLPVHLSVNPAVYALPSALYASVGPSDELPRLNVLLISDDPDSRLEVSPSTYNNKYVSIRRMSQEGGRVRFEVTPVSLPNGTIPTVLTFTTNSVEAPIVRVPLVLKRSQY